MTLILINAGAVAAIAAAGWAFGRRRPAVNLPLLALAMFLAITAHSVLQTAFVDTRLDAVVGHPVERENPLLLLVVAAGEAAGLWLLFTIVPWTEFGPRVWTSIYALAAAILAAAYFYYPYDLVVMSRDIMPSDGPPYLLAAVACLPIALVGYLMGWAGRLKEVMD